MKRYLPRAVLLGIVLTAILLLQAMMRTGIEGESFDYTRYRASVAKVATTDIITSVQDYERKQATPVVESPEETVTYVPGIVNDLSASSIGEIAWSAGDLATAIEQYKNSVPVSNMVSKTVGDITYPQDIQSGIMTGGTGGSFSYGCMLFTSAAAASIVTGNVYGVASLLQLRGYTVTADATGNMCVSPEMPTVGLDGSKQYPDGQSCTIDGLLHNICTVRRLSGSLNDVYDADLINNGGVYIVHCRGDSSNKLSSGSAGEHWFIIAGKYYDGNYIVLNGSGSDGRNGLMSPDDASLLNHIYEVKQ